MKNLCKHFSGVVKSEPTHLVGTLRAALKTTSLACILATALTACNNEESFDMPDAGKLSINVGVNHSTSRSLITAATLPDGDEGAIGVMLTDGDGTLTDYDAFTNVKFTGATTSGSQKWTGATDVLLTENPGTLYAYYPWKDGTNLSAIAIETASQTDYLYATPVTGISETKANADVVMNHVLTNINLSFADGTYAGVGNITSVSVSGDGIATGGTFNAAQETPGFVADSYTGVGDVITNTTATTLGGNAIDIMVVSNDAEKPITIAATIDGVEYTATTNAVELSKGNSYQYTLTLNSTFLSVSKVSVTPWNNVVKENLTLEKSWNELSDGVYAVAANGLPATKVDNTCIGVALVQGEHRFMIEKYEETQTIARIETYNEFGATNTDYIYFYWGEYAVLQENLQDYIYVDGTNNNGWLPKPDSSFGGTTHLSGDYTNWTSGALSDFSGKANSEVIKTFQNIGGDFEKKYPIMGKYLIKFNETYSENQGFTDWYIPACGQLALIGLNFDKINDLLIKIGGTDIKKQRYYSSSEKVSSHCWCLNFNSMLVDATYKYTQCRVRLIRDI